MKWDESLEKLRTFYKINILQSLAQNIKNNSSGFSEHIEKVCKRWPLESQYCIRFEPVYLLNSDFTFIIALFALLCLTLTWFGQIATKSRLTGS